MDGAAAAAAGTQSAGAGRRRGRRGFASTDSGAVRRT